MRRTHFTSVRGRGGRRPGERASRRRSVLPPPAQAAPQWAPAATAAIHPGTMMYTAGAQCTANFVYTDGSGRVYVGYAAHCAGTGTATDTNGCHRLAPARDPRHLQQGRQPRARAPSSATAPSSTPPGGHARTWAPPTRTPVPTTTWPWSRSLPPTSRRSTRRSRSGWPDRRRHRWHRGRRPGLHLRQLQPAVGITQLSPKTGISLGDDAADGGWSHPLYTPTRASRETPARRSSPPMARRSARCPPWASPRCPCRTTSATSPRSRRSLRPTPESPGAASSTARKRRPESL